MGTRYAHDDLHKRLRRWAGSIYYVIEYLVAMLPYITSQSIDTQLNNTLKQKPYPDRLFVF